MAREIAKKLGAKKLLVSVAAGVPLARIEAGLAQGARVVRVMPNIACVVGAGAAGYAGGAHATAADLEKVGAILNSFGVGMAVEEKYLDAVTGLERQRAGLCFSIHGSARRRRRAGRPGARRRAQARHANRLRRRENGAGSNKHLGELKDEVTSPGGTTIAGLYAMEQKGFHGIVMDAVVSATKRSQELGKG